MALWRALAAATAAATVAVAVAATAPASMSAAEAAPAAPAAAAVTPVRVGGALPTVDRQCTQAGDFPHHDGCSATVPSVVVPLYRLAGRWVMRDLSNDAKNYVKGLFGLGAAAQITCPTMAATVRRGVLAVNLCLTSRPEGGVARSACRRWTVRYGGAGGGRRALLWRPAGGGGRTPPPPLPPVKIVAVKSSRYGRVHAFAIYQCPAGNAPPRLPCAQKGPPEVMGMWSRTPRYPGMSAYQVATKLRLGIELQNEFQLLDCPKFRS